MGDLSHLSDEQVAEQVSALAREQHRRLHLRDQGADPGPRLIHYPQSMPWPVRLRDSADHYRGLPFDGVTVGGQPYSAHNATIRVYQPRELSYPGLLREVSGMPDDLGNLKHNFYLTRVTHSFDWLDKAWRDTVVQNHRLLARALRASGKPFRGLFMDLESYAPGINPWKYGATKPGQQWVPSDTEGATPGLSPQEARALVRGMGREVMAEMIDEWPDLHVISTHGPWVSSHHTKNALNNQGMFWNDIAWANELLGSFVIGLMEAVWNNPGSGAQVVEAAEVYQATTRSQMGMVWDHLRRLPEIDTDQFHPDDAAWYQATMQVGLGTYDRDVDNDYAQFSPQQVRAINQLALAGTDHYAWFYSEGYEWGTTPSGNPRVPADYLRAVRAARTAN